MICIILAFGANFISCWIRIRIRNADPGDKFDPDTDPDPKYCVFLYTTVQAFFCGGVYICCFCSDFIFAFSLPDVPISLFHSFF